MKCPLCNSNSKLILKPTHYRCNSCLAYFKDPKLYLQGKDEKDIYDQHKNNSDDIRYQDFLSPITNAVLKEIPKNSIGLDFGCGKDSAIMKVLNNNNYKCLGYDIFYKNNKELLAQKYDYITSSEVIEHFYNPKKEFELLKSLLKPNGVLYLMTDIFDEQTKKFSSWYYKNDPTHVFMYQKQTFEVIKELYGFNKVQTNNRLIKLYL